MKVIFLDIDEVLVNRRTMIAFGPSTHATAITLANSLDSIAVLILRKISKLSGCEIILSSTWRLSPDWREIGRITKLGITDRTPRLQGPRGLEIQHYLKERGGITHYAIIDDDSDMLPDQMDHFVRIDGINGISFQNFERICKLLDVDIYDVGKVVI